MGKIHSPKTQYDVIATVTENTYTDADLTIDSAATVTFYYRVSALDEDGFESPFSPESTLEYTPYD